MFKKLFGRKPAQPETTPKLTLEEVEELMQEAAEQAETLRAYRLKLASVRAGLIQERNTKAAK